MISEGYINKLLSSYIKTPAGQALVKHYRQDVFNGKISSAGTNILSAREMNDLGNKLKDILYAEISGVIPSFAKEGINVSFPKETTDGEYEILVTLTPDSIQRNSLWKEGYPDGVDDIVLLFTTGYKARKSLRGEWHGKSIYSKNFRLPDGFLQRAIDAFNASIANDAEAELGTKYRK